MLALASLVVCSPLPHLINHFGIEQDQEASLQIKAEYFGGPVISNVQVYPIFYGNGVRYTSDLPGFYAGVTNSKYFDWLSEYNTPTQAIGRGSYVKSIYVTNNIKYNMFDSTDIQSLVQSLAQQGQIRPNANTYYPIHLAPGISVTLEGTGTTCKEICAYHSATQFNGQNIYYGVIPDPGCSSCGKYDTDAEAVTSAASHELVEAVTDPAVGLASGLGAPLAWYDRQAGEIGDMCANNDEWLQGGNGNWYKVQKIWSNQRNSCIYYK
ncbi:hypothetical protein EDD86DRAFT_198903 [Gorgonomyces haynaldii]|nr:hypothetical protein EDD86DRAFT_198903 [Gorgonomyces haynaldii]